MANQIAANFAHHPADQAAGEVANHLRTFWAPAMRANLTAWWEKSDPNAHELHPLVVSALGLLRPHDTD
jgi:formate dehydrogenase subunit delta